MDDADSYEQAFYPGDPKVSVYDAQDVALFCAQFPRATDRLKNMPLFEARGNTYLIRKDVWNRLGGTLEVKILDADPRCDEYRRSAMKAAGPFDPAAADVTYKATPTATPPLRNPDSRV